MRKTFALILAFLMVIGLFAGCAQEPNNNQDENHSGGNNVAADDETNNSDSADSEESGDVIKVGVMASWTGVPLCATEQERGTEMAADEINAAGGILGKEIVFVIEDSGDTTDMGINAFNKLASEDIVAIIGPQFSSQAMALDTSIQNAEIPVIANATSPKTVDLGNEWLFRVRPSDAIQAEAAVKHLIDDTSAEKIGIFYSNDEMGAAGAEIARDYADANDVEYVEESHTTTDTDFTTQILKFKEAGVDAMFIWTPLETIYATIARQMYDLGLDVIGAGAPGLITTASIGNMEPEWIEGWFAASDIIISNPDQNVQDFITDYKEKYSDDIYPDQNTAGTYMATKALAEAIEDAGSTDRESIREALMNIQGLEGVLGTVNVNEHGEFVNSISVGKIKDGVVEFAEQVIVE